MDVYIKECCKHLKYLQPLIEHYEGHYFININDTYHILNYCPQCSNLICEIPHNERNSLTIHQRE